MFYFSYFYLSNIFVSILSEEKKTKFLLPCFFYSSIFFSICAIKNKTINHLLFFRSGFWYLFLVYTVNLLKWQHKLFFPINIHVCMYTLAYISLSLVFFVRLSVFFLVVITRIVDRLRYSFFLSRLVLRMCTRQVNLLFHLRFFFCKRCVLYVFIQ